VGARLHEAAPTATCWYFSYYGGVSCPGLELYVRPGRVIFAFPTNDASSGSSSASPPASCPSCAPTSRAASWRRSTPSRTSRRGSGAAGREERFYGATQLPDFLRQSWGDGWALVGDAGCHKDPFMALGICDALRDAELLAEALTDGLSDRCPIAKALAGYQQRRDDATRADFRTNLARAQLGPIPKRSCVCAPRCGSTRRRPTTSSRRCRGWSRRSRSSTTRTSLASCSPRARRRAERPTPA
jgi:hypothetical protein